MNIFAYILAQVCVAVHMPIYVWASGAELLYVLFRVNNLLPMKKRLKVLFKKRRVAFDFNIYSLTGMHIC